MSSLAELARLYKVGWSLQEIADMTGIPKSTVYGRIRPLVELRARGGNQRFPSHRDMHMTIYLYVHMKMSSNDIARRMGVNQSTVVNRLRTAGVPLRPRPEAIRLSFARIPMTVRRTPFERKQP